MGNGLLMMMWLSSMKSGQPNATLRGVPFASFILSLYFWKGLISKKG
jgi:hypothetical protein